MKRRLISVAFGSTLLIALGTLALTDDDRHEPILPLPPAPTLSVSTVPPNGDLNPYGVAFVPEGFPRGGPLHRGDIVVSNFNNAANLQGTGTTIVAVTPAGDRSVFFEGPQGLGLTTALGVLRQGFVLVGNLPSPSGSCTEGPGGEELGVEQGSLIVLDDRGSTVANLKSAKFLDGPWDLAMQEEGDHARVFVSNVLNGTVARLDLKFARRDGDDQAESHTVIVERATRIASGYSHRCDPAALVVGPTGLAYDAERDILYVASTADNAIFAIPNAARANRDHGLGRLVYQDSAHLHGPLGLALAPNGDLITSNGDAVNPDPNQPSEIVEFTPQGQFVAEFSIDPAPGAAFGIAVAASDDEIRLAAVDDGTNMLDVWTLR
jgi:hypothetical protein